MNDEIFELIENKNFIKLKNLIKDMHVPDIANLLSEIEDTTVVIKIFRLLPKDIGADVFAEINNDLQESIAHALNDKELAYIMEELCTDDAVDFIEEMPANVVERALKMSTPETRSVINKFMSYVDGTAGAVMTSEFLDLRANRTVKEALKRIRNNAKHKETINIMYITDNSRILKGVVSIRDILTTEEDILVSDIMESNVIFAYTNTNQEELANLFRKYDFIALPIVDNEQRLVGIVTVDDILDVIEEETTEDFEKMAGITSASDDEPYLKTGSFKLASRRVVWLTALMISAIFTGLLISLYEDAFVMFPELIACLPMLMGTGGNCGTQTSTLIIRGLATNEITIKDFFKIFFKEMKVSIIIGAFLSVFTLVRVGLQYSDWLLAGAVSSSLMIIILIANFLGFALPLLAKKCKLDPALMATPIITTILDCCVVLVYFSLASAILGI